MLALNTRDRNRPFLQDRVLPLLVPTQTPANSKFKSKLPQPTYHRHSTVLSNVTPTIQLGEVIVYLFTIRAERPPIVNTRHQNRFHCTNLCIPRQISIVLVLRRNVLEQLANGTCPSSTSCVTSQHCVHSSSQQSKLAFRVANVTTFLHVEQGHSSPILFADQMLIQG